jgi:endoglucanase
MLLRSFLMDDKKTFDLVYSWSKYNLQRKDGLFSWLWGENKNGDYKILDQNSASDADVDIAFSLILAYEKWGDKNYLDNALIIINSIWQNETRDIDGHQILTPGVVQNCCDKVELNPSYFSPYAFRLFQKYDSNHDWDKVVDSSYYLLDLATQKSAIGLPPDWFVLQNGQVVLEDGRSNFSYDAIRVFPRIFLDYKMTGDKRALSILSKSNFFISEWKNSKTIYTSYKPNGEKLNQEKYIGAIALLVPIINMYDEKVALEIYTDELYPYFKSKGYWEDKKEYYGQNLLWFGYYLYKNLK